MKKAILIVAVFFYQFTFSQNVIINIHFEKANGSSMITFGSSFDNETSHFIYSTDLCYIKDNSFKKIFTQKGMGLIQIVQNEDIPYTLTLPCKDGDELNLDIKTINEKLTVIFSGTNASGMDLLNNSPDFYRLYRSVGSILQTKTTSIEILDSVDNLDQGITQQLDKLLNETKISKSFYAFTKLYLQTEIITWFYANLRVFIETIKENPNLALLKKEEIQKTIQGLDVKYNVFDEKYKNIKTDNQYHNILNKCFFIDEKILSKQKTYSTPFQSESLKNLIFVPKDLQEFLIYNEIIKKGDFDLVLYKKYKDKMPTGIYLNILKQKYSNIIESKK